ncbi:MAG: hypothetical protein AAGI17_05640 [Planctomycetota bacterium]
MSHRNPVRTPVYVRFVTPSQDPDSHAAIGLFTAVYDLRDSGELLDHEESIVEAELDWFRMHLTIPGVLCERGNHRAICWFHPRARRPITKARTLAWILNEHGVAVRQLTTKTPGKLIYADGWQIAAIPWRSTPRL